MTFLILLFLALSPYIALYLIRKYNKRSQRIQRIPLTKKECKRWIEELRQQMIERAKEESRCPLCGSKVSEDDLVCPYCGCYLGETSLDIEGDLSDEEEEEEII